MYWLGASEHRPEWKEPFKSEIKHDGELKPRDTFDIVSYNILSLESGEDDFYRNLDGTPKRMDKIQRKDCITEKVEKWMKMGKIICLQEVTASFLLSVCNSTLERLRTEHKYNIYFHFYAYMPNKIDRTQKGTCSLGLAVMIPSEYYIVEQTAILRPWESADMSIDDKKSISTLNEKLENSVRLLRELGTNKDDNNLKAKAIDLIGIDEVYLKVQKANIFESLKDIDSEDALQLLGVCETSGFSDTSRRQAFEFLVKKPELKFLNGGILLPFLNKTNETIRKRITHIADSYKKSAPRFADRSVLVVHVKNHDLQELVVANIHAPCQYRYPKLMTSIALNTKKSILNWMTEKKLSDVPMILCGDFNSGKSDSAYQCFTGAMEYESSASVNRDNISKSDFERFVGNERWSDALSRINAQGCTNYGFSANSFNESCDAFKSLMDTFRPRTSRFIDIILESKTDNELESEAYNSLYSEYLKEFGMEQPSAVNELISDLKIMHKSKNSFFKPKQLLLDHFFLRRGEKEIEISCEKCSPSWLVENMTNGQPIPDLEKKQPSDHLPIFVRLNILDLDHADGRSMTEPVRSTIKDEETMKNWPERE